MSINQKRKPITRITRITRKVLTEKSPYLLILIDYINCGPMYYNKEFVVEKFVHHKEKGKTYYRLIYSHDILIDDDYCKILKKHV